MNHSIKIFLLTICFISSTLHTGHFNDSDSDAPLLSQKKYTISTVWNLIKNSKDLPMPIEHFCGIQAVNYIGIVYITFVTNMLPSPTGPILNLFISSPFVIFNMMFNYDAYKVVKKLIEEDKKRHENALLNDPA